MARPLETPPVGAPGRLRPVLGLALTAALLGYVGCGSPRTESERAAAKPAPPSAAPKAAPVAEADAAPAAKGKKLFQNWPKPAGALVISGEQLGYLEPCGCTQGQLGGLIRRYDFVERLRDQQGWPLVMLDLGSLIKDPAAARGGPEQSKLKFHTALKALSVLKYDAVALSPEDLKMGVAEAFGEFLNLPDAGPRIVAANVEAAGFETKVVPSLRAQAGPVQVGVTAVIDPERIKALKDPSLDLIQTKPVEETLPKILADLEKDTHTQVLLVQGPPELGKALAEKYPGFDVVVRTSVGADPELEAETLNGGKTLLVHVGQKGKYVGVVGLFQDPKQKYRYQRVTLGTQYDGAAKPMKAVIEDEFRETLKQQGVVANFPRHDFVNGAGGASGAKFVGAETCKSCHPNTVARWASTKHALAFESLVRDPKPNAVFDAECVTCHTTGFEYTSGWVSADATPYLKGNQCENCHGPASKHVTDPDNADARAALHLTAELADKNRLCLRCHDEDNSPHFEFAKYWGQVVHKGLDDMKDPKVHRGVTPRVAAQSGR